MKYKVYGGSFKIFFFNQFMKMLRPRIIFQFKKRSFDNYEKCICKGVFLKRKSHFFYSLKIKSKKKVEKKSEAH